MTFNHIERSWTKVPFTKIMNKSHNPQLEQDALLFDMLWLVSLYLQPGRTPMWIGWNSKVIYDPLPQQWRGYSSQINESATDNNVVLYEDHSK